ncbi:MAG: hypothetical protein R3222_02050, partial [Balneolaceae bacterium]|nr:hypothetical protein [Balneolaceae bacterium]
MGIDTIIDYACVPKEVLGNQGILERLKSREQAEAVVQVYRDQGDHRPLDEIGFEITRQAADGSMFTDTRIVADVLEQAAALDDLSDHCINCPANRGNLPFGCMYTLNYPFSEVGEVWLLQQLPPAGSPLLHILNRGIEEYSYDGETARQLRFENPGTYFEADESLGRPYPDEDLIITTDMLFEMMFMVGSVLPAHAAMLLLFLNAISREDVGPDELFWLMNGTMEQENIPALQIQYV